MNKRLTLYRILTSISLFLIIGCGCRRSGSEANQKFSANVKTENPTYNVILLLDLSQRIIDEEDQVGRDTQLVSFICKEFVPIIRDNNGVSKSKESIRIRIADQDKIPYTTSQFADSLYFKMSRDVRGGFPAIMKILNGRFSRNLETLYDLALFSDNPEDYHGANLSRYFIQDLENDIKRDSMTKNLLFILTDGYLNLGSQENVMMDVHNTFPELSVMVMEMVPKNTNEYESEHLAEAWDNWFASMGIKGYCLRSKEPIGALTEDISRFLEGTLELDIPGKKDEVLPVVHPPVVGEEQVTEKETEKETEQPTIEVDKPPPPEITKADPPKKTKTAPNPKKTETTATVKKITFPNGDFYEGEVLNGKPHGIGFMIFKNARIFSENDIRQTKVEAGEKYQGSWLDGEPTMGRIFDSEGKYKSTVVIGSE